VAFGLAGREAGADEAVPTKQRCRRNTDPASRVSALLKRIAALLLSMTGFGEAHRQQEGLAVSVEVRAINSRYFKLSVRCTEGYSGLEPRLEAAIRRNVRRGTIQLNLRVERARSPDDYRMNLGVLAGYRRQLAQWLEENNEASGARRGHAASGDSGLVDGDEARVPLWALLALPGVVEEAPARNADLEAEWPLIDETLQSAIEMLAQMRREEGRAMADDLRANCGAILENLEQVATRAPLVVDEYRQRLTERVGRALADFEVAIEPAELAREISLFAERSDISEEIVRLRSHVEQFDQTLDAEESTGRKLEFLTQEMFRETNTIGSKANDVEIARNVIEIKSAIERLREMVQNVE
jgi:uncharacterized protein (TIGR00255 family)